MAIGSSLRNDIHEALFGGLFFRIFSISYYREVICIKQIKIFGKEYYVLSKEQYIALRKLVDVDARYSCSAAKSHIIELTTQIHKYMEKEVDDIDSQLADTRNAISNARDILFSVDY